MRIAIYADAECGQGHVVRCSALEQELLDRGHTLGYGVFTDWQDFVRGCRDWPQDAVVIDTYRPPMYEHILAPVVISIPDDIEPLGPAYAMLRPEFRKLRSDSLEMRSKGGSTARRLVITSGGMSALEFACMGVPMLVYEQHENQRAQIAALVEAGAAWEVSEPYWGNHWDEYCFPAKFEQDHMAAAGMELVDGLGCVRTADMIEKRVEESGKQ